MSLLYILAIIGIALLGGVSQVLLKYSLNRDTKLSWLFGIPGGLGFIAWFWLLIRGFAERDNSGCYIMLLSLAFVLMLSVIFLKERLSITKVTAYILVASGIWIIYFPPSF